MIMALLAMAAAYLLGSIPTAYLLGRLQGIDIRQAGSGNVGTMNARLVLGWRSALLVLLLDLAKGMLSVWLAVILHINPCLLLLLAVIGHICSLWLRGQGGKGLAAACGGMLVLHQWLPLLILSGLAGCLPGPEKQRQSGSGRSFVLRSGGSGARPARKRMAAGHGADDRRQASAGDSPGGNAIID